MGQTPAAISPFAATTARARPQSSKFEAGAVVGGRYRLVRYLARGGMAEVWLATHESLKCDVAIKFIDKRLIYFHDSAIERFRMEAQVSARLGARTKHVVAVQDAGEHEGLPYLVMEFVPGRTLADEIEQTGPLDPARLADLLDQAADALAAAHALGIVHRDLKPSNLLLVDDPPGKTTLKISDFGIAKALRSDVPVDRPKETTAGQLIGSPAYMSPEQIDGRKDIDARSDIWALGAVCYEALTGRTCFDSSSMVDLMMMIGAAKYTPASRARPELPRALDAWFARALVVSPEERFGSAVEMAQAFRAAIAPKRDKEHGKERDKRSPVWFIAAGAGVLVGALLFFLLSEASPRPTASAVIASASTDVKPAPTPVEPTAPRIELAPVTTITPITTAAPSTEPSSKGSLVRPKATATATAAASSTGKPPVKKGIDKSEIQ